MKIEQAVSEFAALVKHAEAAIARGDRLAALTEISRAEHHLDMMSPRERAATPDGFVRRFVALRNVLDDEFTDAVTASGFHGLGAGLGLTNNIHREERGLAARAAETLAARGLKELKENNCEGAFTEMLAAKEFLGNARAHGWSMDDGNLPSGADGTARAVADAVRDSAKLIDGFRKKCMRKK